MTGDSEEPKYKGEGIDEFICGGLDSNGLIQGLSIFKIGAKKYTGKFNNSEPVGDLLITEEINGLILKTAFNYVASSEAASLLVAVSKKITEGSYTYRLQYSGEIDEAGNLLAGEYEYVVECEKLQNVITMETGKGKFSGFTFRSHKDILVPGITSGVREIGVNNNTLKQRIEAESFGESGDVDKG